MNAKEFRVWRKAMGLSLTGMAIYLKVSRRTIARWQAGDAPIPRWVPQDYEFWLAQDRKRRRGLA